VTPIQPHILDAHHHIWDPDRRLYAWLDSAPPILRRRFDLDDFAAATAGLGVEATVLVQALGQLDETDELLETAADHPLVAGVVGWVDLTAFDIEETIARLREHPGGSALVGVRHLVQDEPDDAWLARPEVHRGLKAVSRAGLSYDLLVLPRQLPAAIAAVDAVDNLRFVLDHGAKPPIGSGEFEPWSTLIGELSEREHVWCKLSGITSEAGRDWSVDQVVPYGTRILDAFSPQRVMFGSDWPVCEAFATYGEVLRAARACLNGLSNDESRAVFGANAARFYRLPWGPDGHAPAEFEVH